MLKTRTRIHLIGLVAIIGAILAALVQFRGLEIIRQQQDEFHRAQALIEATLLADNSILSARRAESELIQTHDRTQVERFIAATESAQSQIAVLKQSIGALAQARDVNQNIESVSASLTLYRSTFDTLVVTEQKLGIGKDNGVDAKLAKIARETEALIATDADDSFFADFQKLRQYEREFRYTASTEAEKAFNERADVYSKRIEAMFGHIARFAEINRKVRQYLADFNHFVSLQRALESDLARVSDSYVATDRQINSLRAAIRVVVDEKQVEIKAATGAARNLAWMLACTILLLVLFVAFFVSRSVTVPLARLQGSMLRLAGGELNAEVQEIKRTDEIGEMARAVNQFRNGLIENNRLREESRQQTEAEADSRRMIMRRVAEDFELQVGQIVGTVSAAVEQMSMSVSHLSAAMQETSTQSQYIVGASVEASRGATMIASATQQVSASIESVAESIARSAVIAGRALTDTHGMTTAMTELQSAVANVASIIGVINSVAEQTNLLALNATIEAARAGPHGRGFAVVASEVKSLAAKTGEATNEITARIGEMNRVTSDAGAAAGNISNTIAEMQALAGAIAASMIQQSAAVHAIAENTSLASANADSAQDGVKQMARTAMDTSTSSQQLAITSAALRADAQRLRQEVAEFLATLKSA